MMKKIPKNFCWRPFTELYYSYKHDEVSACCYSKKYPYKDFNDLHKNIRDDILNNRWSPDCSHCEKLESSGAKSHRMEFNGYRNTGLIGENKFLPHNLELQVDNHCNLACVMCSGGSSSKWVSEINRMGSGELPLETNKKSDLNKFFDTSLWGNVKNLTIFGGEPLYSKNTLKLLTWLIDNKFSQNINLRFYTNGTTYNEKIESIFKNFKTINLSFSIDGIGKRYEIVRWPSKWQNVVDNFKKFQNLENVEVSIIYTLGTFNAVNLINDLKELRNLTKNISMNFVYNPEYYDVKNLPNEIKTTLINEYKNDEIAAMCIPVLERVGSNELYEQGMFQLKKLDWWRKTDREILFKKDNNIK